MNMSDITISKDYFEQLLAVVEAAKEIDEILQDPEARKEIDSFTNQPLREALAVLEEDV